MVRDDQANQEGGLYERRIGTPKTADEVNGYWLFGFGVLLGLVGVALFLLTERGTTARGIGYALAALAPPFIMLGAVIRFPLRRTGTSLGYLGIAVSVLAVVWFVNIFPDGWSTTTGETTIIAVYSVGLFLIGLAGTVVPLLSDPVYEDYERMRGETAAATATAEETSGELDATREELETTREELAATESELETAREERSETKSELEAAREEATAAEAAAASLRESKARFELFEDASGKPRWRLRHRNGNVIAASGQGYSSRGKAQQGLHSVRRNALGAGLLRIETPVEEAEAVADDDGPEPEDAAEPDVAIPDESAAPESRATFELFADNADEWRFRLRHDNGNVVGDSGEGYASKSNAKRALAKLRDHVAAADYLRIDPAAFEVFRDAAGEYRWRLVHENGNILADSGEGYASRQKARQGLDSVRSNAGGAGLAFPDDEGAEGRAGDGEGKATFEAYEDRGGSWRWRLVHDNGNILADGGEGYASKSNATDAVERVGEYAPDANALAAGSAAFEIYEDAAEEWRWRLRHRNGNVLADSGEGYASRSNAVEAVTRVKANAPGAETVEK
ncbi:HVO_2922 family protein [Halorubrum distributum]|uniref:HVO_2922 family protein n=1 Tax=Halorubrum distributum TaxID=29283 RepID=UPI0029533A29|nr:HVO_2922 family protein [Halorubrum distributum]MDV7350351.1 HVO_2922 family protein [Halorubrum distributum]